MSKHNWEYVWEAPFELAHLDKPEELAETVWGIASGFPVHYNEAIYHLGESDLIQMPGEFSKEQIVEVLRKERRHILEMFDALGWFDYFHFDYAARVPNLGVELIIAFYYIPPEEVNEASTAEWYASFRIWGKDWLIPANRKRLVTHLKYLSSIADKFSSEREYTILNRNMELIAYCSREDMQEITPLEIEMALQKDHKTWENEGRDDMAQINWLINWIRRWRQEVSQFGKSACLRTYSKPQQHRI